MSHSLPQWPASLDRSFEALVFDWDGTAVDGRAEEARDLADRVDLLLGRGVWILVVTGTHLGHLERQLLGGLKAPDRRLLFLGTNRGSEIHGFPDGATLERLAFRRASLEEEKALDSSILALQKLFWKEFHLSSEVVYDRMNRRKLDLIPTPEWQDPPKSKVSQLLGAIEARLGRHEGRSALAWMVDAAVRIARERGLSSPRVTTDLKHIELGLTDKSDSVRWFFEHVLQPQSISPEQVVLAGDEWGSPGDVSGSDRRMVIPELEGCPQLSVGIEPAGVPAGVVHAPGGARSFLDFLDLQLACHQWGLSSDPAWCVEQARFDPSREREMETLFAIGNGRIGVRAALEVGIPSSDSGFFVAGVYDAKSPVMPYLEREFMTGGRRGHLDAELVSFPFPFRVDARIAGERVRLREESAPQVRRRLDLSLGVLHVEQSLSVAGFRFELESRRLASLESPDCLLHEVEFRFHEGAARIEVEVGVDFEEFHFRHPHLVVVHPKGEEPWSGRAPPGLSELMEFETRHSRVRVGLASRMEVDGRDISGKGWSQVVSSGRVVRIRRVIWIRRALNQEKDLREILLQQAGKWSFQDFHRRLAGDRRHWRAYWQRSDLQFSKDAGMTESHRFSAYHLRIAAPSDEGHSVPARGLIGRGYEGHIFWDAEIFVMPFYSLRFPEFARRLIGYRYATLDAARRRAKSMGCRGASFAWESTVSGDDVTPEQLVLRSTGETIPIHTGRQQIHITADIAHALWQYWRFTGDSELIRQEGAEILLETARFWVTRSIRDRGSFHIRQVVGPDEYHFDVNDNAYTNWMARFNVQHALAVRDWLLEVDPRRLSLLMHTIGMNRSEWADLEAFVREIYLPVSGADGVIEQFEGFFDLEALRLDPKDRIKAPVGRLLDWKHVNRLRICKQADVLMLPFLFPDRFTPEQIRANYRYYEPITDHGSSLSLPVHAMVAALCGEKEDAVAYHQKAVELDLFNLMGNTALGIHAACMGGSWQALVFGLLGVRIEESGPALTSVQALPVEWGKVRLRLMFRGEEHLLEAA